MIRDYIILLLAIVCAYLFNAVQNWRERALKAEGELSTINHTAFDAMANRAGSKPAFSESKPLPEPVAGFKTGSQLKAEAHAARVASPPDNGEVLTELDIAHLKG